MRIRVAFAVGGVALLLLALGIVPRISMWLAWVTFFCAVAALVIAFEPYEEEETDG